MKLTSSGTPIKITMIKPVLFNIFARLGADTLIEKQVWSSSEARMWIEIYRSSGARDIHVEIDTAPKACPNCRLIHFGSCLNPCQPTDNPIPASTSERKLD